MRDGTRLVGHVRLILFQPLVPGEGRVLTRIADSGHVLIAVATPTPRGAESTTTSVKDAAAAPTRSAIR
jgi:hypothetical protein